MRKSVIFLTLVILLLIALVAFLTTRNAHVAPAPIVVQHSAARTARQTIAKTFPPPVSSAPFQSVKPELQVLQVGVQQSAELERNYDSWRSARGCNGSEYGIAINAPESALQAWTLNGDLTAANELALDFIFKDTNHDGRPEARRILWQTMLQGSICAITTYDIFWRRAHNGRRQVIHSHVNGQDYAHVHYLLNIPQTDAAKRQALMNDYAWDLVYEMRAGTPPLGSGSFGTYEGWYHFKFQPTAAEYAYACQRANDLYETLQSDREAQGLGPFDNTPQPLALRFGTMGKPAVGLQCSHWPVPRQGWEAAEFHLVQHDGTITSFPLWVVKSDISMSAEQSQ